MEPQRLVDALALTCRPRTGREALVLAVQACVLRALGDKGVEVEVDETAPRFQGACVIKDGVIR